MNAIKTDLDTSLTSERLFWCTEGKVGELVQPGGASEDFLGGLLCGTSGRRKLCMVSCHSCHIYGIERSKNVGKTLKPSFGVAMQATRRDNF